MKGDYVENELLRN